MDIRVNLKKSLINQIRITLIVIRRRKREVAQMKEKGKEESKQ